MEVRNEGNAVDGLTVQLQSEVTLLTWASSHPTSLFTKRG